MTDTTENQPQGIKGWLILPAIGLPLEMMSCTHGLWVSLLLIPFLGIIAVLNLLVMGILLAMSIGVAFFFYRKKKLTIKAVVAQAIIRIVITGIMFYIAAEASATMPSHDIAYSQGHNMMAGFLHLFTWVPYFLMSKRVRNTFTEPGI